MTYEIKNILDTLVLKFQEILGDTLVGVYLHGSLAMNVFNPVSSDTDFLVVVRDELALDKKREIGRMLIALSEGMPGKGFEMSIIKKSVLDSFQYPTPYEFHFSYSDKEAALNIEEPKLEKTDLDLAAHFVVTKNRGICLYGEPIENLFPNVPGKYYLQSIAHDSEWSFNNIKGGKDVGCCPVPVYGVLNFCRVLAYIEQGLITSKTEGGAWALEHLPREYAPLIKEALQEYKKSGTSKEVDAVLLKQFADYCWMAIQAALRNHG